VVPLAIKLEQQLAGLRLHGAAVGDRV